MIARYYRRYLMVQVPPMKRRLQLQSKRLPAAFIQSFIRSSFPLLACVHREDATRSCSLYSARTSGLTSGAVAIDSKKGISCHQVEWHTHGKEYIHTQTTVHSASATTTTPIHIGGLCSTSLWHYGTVTLWHYGTVALWRYDTMAL